jgi:hypothetical protein
MTREIQNEAHDLIITPEQEFAIEFFNYWFDVSY